MMENKIIHSTNVGPMVEMDVSGKICISGKAMMEDASLYFAACHEWIDQYIASKKESLQFEIELNYFNSSSAKQLMKMLMNVDDSDIDGKVIWIYPSENDVLLERGQELAIMLDLPFEYSPK